MLKVPEGKSKIYQHTITIIISHQITVMVP